MGDTDDLRDFLAGIDGFADWSHADKIRMFAWLQHFLFKKEYFQTSDINWCYDALRFGKTNTSQLLSSMVGKELLQDKRKGFFCEGKFKAKWDGKYGEHEITLNVRQMVKDLENLLPDLAEKDIFKEALICLRHDAGRAAIIMVWNIAFYHLCQYVLTHKIAEFNASMPQKYPHKWKGKVPVIAKYEDFAEELKESEVIGICYHASIITKEMNKVYTDKLDKRNSAAHPSVVRVDQVIAEAFISDLLQNTVAMLKI